MHPSAHRRLLASVGIYATRLTPTSKMEGLIQDLRPIGTDKGLVRIGPAGDGGYLVPNDLENLAACFSPGVDMESGFELMLARMGIPVFMADATVAEPAAHHPLFFFTPKFIGAVESSDTITLDSWIAASIARTECRDLILQMDIEGTEWEVLLNASPEVLRRFRIMVVEMHDLDDLWSRPVFALYSRVIRRLLNTHAVVHVHPNNNDGAVRVRGLTLPRSLEVTLLRHDRIKRRSPVAHLPHPLDTPNVEGPSLELDSSWYGS